MSRNARHRMSRVMLKERWGETLRLTEAQDELRVHGRRMARLHRILVLSKEEKKDTVEERVKVAIEKEQQRYQHHMEELRSTVGAKGADSPGAPAQAGAPTPTPGAAGSAP